MDVNGKSGGEEILLIDFGAEDDKVMLVPKGESGGGTSTSNGKRRMGSGVEANPLDFDLEEGSTDGLQYEKGQWVRNGGNNG